MNYYQITWDELLEPDKEWLSEPEPALERGVIDYMCPICGSCVGLYSIGTIHEEGWLYKRDTCQNGHRIRFKEWKGFRKQ